MKKFLGFLCAAAAAVYSFAGYAATAHAIETSEVGAKGAVLMDARTGEIIFEKNADERLPMASTTKIMSALLAIELSDDLDEEFVVDSEAIKVEGSSMGLKEGDTVSLRALLHGMLLPSGNDAANATAVRVAGSIEGFVQLMNDRAAEMGLENTHFVTPSGLDDNTDDHYSTAADMAELTRQAMNNDTFREICGKKTAKVKFGAPPYERWLTNTNKLLVQCDGVIGVKTGFTDKARRCLVSACERNGARLICVTLNDPDDWFDHSRLYDYGFSLLSPQSLPLDNDSFEVPIVGGCGDTILCKAQKTTVFLRAEQLPQVECRVYLPRFIYAPAAENAAVGRVEYYLYGEKLAETEILTAECAVRKTLPRKKGFFEFYFDKIRCVLGA